MISEITGNQTTLSQIWIAEKYSQSSFPQCNLAREVLQNHIFSNNEKVLDIGCGDGTISSFVAKEKVPYGSVMGIDASSSMIEWAQMHHHEKNVTFEIAKAETFNFDNLFDLIISFSCLHWIDDQQIVWNNIRKHLKIGGLALVSLNPQPRNHDFASAIDETIQEVSFRPYFDGFKETFIMPYMTIDEYRDTVLRAGLKVDRCIQTIKTLELENKESFVNNVKAWLPHVSQLPDDLQDSFVREIATKFMIKTDQHADGKVILPYSHFFIKATRTN